MKRILLAAALAAAPAGLAAQAVTIGVGGQLSAVTGESFRVPIFADMRGAPGERLGSYTVRVTWNPVLLVWAGFDSTTVGTFAEPLVRSDSASAGILKVTAISAAGRDGAFDLFQIILTPVQAGTGTITVQVHELSAATTFTNLLPFVTIVNGTYCPAVGRWGDLDADDVVNSRDALAILSSVVGLPTPGFTQTLGDVDGDGVTNSRDALIVLSYAVGLDIPGQRVLLVAPGGCVTPQTPTLEVLPGTADLVVRQEVQLRVVARNAAGIPTTLTGVNWAVSNLRVAHVDPTGRLVARDTGTAQVTAAVGPGVRVVGQIVVRARRGTWRVDATRAARSTVQTGTTEYPFASPEYAFPYLSEGDTIRIAPGMHDFLDIGNDLQVGAVIIGDTLANGTRPVLRFPGESGTGFEWEGGLRGEIRHLVLRDFYSPIELEGLRNLVVDNVRFEDTQTGTTFGYGIYAEERVDTLRVLRSEFFGDSSESYRAIELNAGAAVVEIADSRFEGWQDGGIYAYNVDSLDVRNSRFANIHGEAIELSTGGNSGTGSTALTLSRSRFVGGVNLAVDANDARLVALDHNYFDVDNGVIYVDGCCEGDPRGRRFISKGDSIRYHGDGYYWLYTNDLDTARIDSLWFRAPPDTQGYAYGDIRADYVRVSNSRFLNLTGEAIRSYGRELVVDTTEFRGCMICDWTSSYGIQAYAGNDSGPRVTLRHSTFFNLYYALYSGTSADSAGPILITNNTVDSVYYGFDVSADSVVIADNVLSRVGYNGIVTQPAYSNRPLRTAVVLRNQVTCLANPAIAPQGIQTHHTPARIEDNGVRGCTTGIFATNSFSPDIVNVSILRDTVIVPSTAFYHVGIRPDYWVRPTVSGNRVVGGYYGIDVTLQDTATARLDSNAVSATGAAAIQLYFVPGTVTGIRNNITNNALDGLLINGGVSARSFTLGRFAGNAQYGINNLGEATVDATQNWWGTAAGANQTGSDVTSGAVDASNHLTVDPTDVPPPAPTLAAALAAGLRRAVAQPLPPKAIAAPGPGARRVDVFDAVKAQRAAERAAQDAQAKARRAAAAQVRQQADVERARRKAQHDQQ